jgi:hypothetical protein
VPGGVALPVLLRRYTDGAVEVKPQGGIGAKPGLLGDLVQRQPGGFQQPSCAVDAHPGEQSQRGGGVRSLADNARAAGASEAEITEAVEVGYVYGGTATLVMGVNAFS